MVRPTMSAVAAAALAFLAAGGCARRETPAESATRAQTLLLGNGAEPEDLDPQIVTAYTDQNILLALFEGLTAVDEKTSQAVPAAAQDVGGLADGLAWTFHLREGLRWSNGEPLTADDFVRSWRRMLSPAWRRIREPPLPHQERPGLQPAAPFPIPGRSASPRPTPDGPD